MNQIIKILSTGLGLGYIPKMPGTFGSLLGLALVFALPPLSSFIHFFVILVISLFAVWISDRAEKIFHEKDCQKIVIDEIAGVLFVFIGIPLNWATVVAGLVLFRFFDITKIPPIRQSQRLPNGWGVVVDDVIAGIFANIVLQIALTLWYAVGM